MMASSNNFETNDVLLCRPSESTEKKWQSPSKTQLDVPARTNRKKRHITHSARLKRKAQPRWINGRRRQSLLTSSESAASRIFIVFPSDKRENVQIDEDGPGRRDPSSSVQLRRIWAAIKWQSPSIVVPNNSLDIQQQQQQFCCCGGVYMYTGRAIRICFSRLMAFYSAYLFCFVPHTSQHSIWHVISTSRVNGCVQKKTESRK